MTLNVRQIYGIAAFALIQAAPQSYAVQLMANVGSLKCQPKQMINPVALGEKFNFLDIKPFRESETADFETALSRVTPAPLWLVQRMDALLKMPPPSLEGIYKQVNASMAIRKKLIAKRRS